MDAIGRQISFKMTCGLLGWEKQGFSGSRDTDSTFGSYGGGVFKGFSGEENVQHLCSLHTVPGIRFLRDFFMMIMPFCFYMFPARD